MQQMWNGNEKHKQKYEYGVHLFKMLTVRWKC